MLFQKIRKTTLLQFFQAYSKIRCLQLLFLLYINDLHTCVYCTLLPIVIYDGFHDSNVCISQEELVGILTKKIKLITQCIMKICSLSVFMPRCTIRMLQCNLAQWSHTWLMPFNYQKCEFLRVTNKLSPILHTYYIENTQIKSVSSATYLGVTINNKLR